MKRLLCMLGLIALLGVPAFSQSSTRSASDSREVMELLISGRRLTSDEVVAAEAKLAKKPSDLDTRFMLIGYYFSHHEPPMRVNLCEHVLWAIKNVPESKRLQYVAEARLRAGEQCFQQAADLWQKNLETRKGNLDVLRNAIDFFMFANKALVEQLIKQGAAAEPSNPEWPHLLARFYSNQMYASKGDERRNFAKGAYEQLELALKSTEDSRRNRLLRVEMMRVALEFDEGKHAQELANELRRDLSGESSPSARSDLLHDIHSTLGRVALLNGDVEEAKRQLIASTAVDASPVLRSFGPNMALAKELLDKGERDIVLNYFAACAQFWKDPRLQQWETAVSDGRVPDFGANVRR